MIDFLIGIDSGILLFIQENIRIPMLTPVVTFITSLGNAGIIWVAISLLLLLIPKYRKVGCASFLALFASLLVNNLLLKNLVARARPYEVIEGLRLIVPKQMDASFPSGHAGSSFASACVLYRSLPKKAGIPALVLATLISLSRLYVGVHYPSDVVAGVVIGIGCGLFAKWAADCLFLHTSK